MSADPAAVPRTLVAIATFGRQEQLERLLESLAHLHPRHRILVVDNDPAASARSTVARFSRVDYVVEARPGIVPARNQALDSLDDEELIAFVDDDEWVAEGWLETLYSAMVDHDAGVVVGPVLPVFPPGAPRWATDGEYFQRRRSVTGTVLRDAPTNNTLVRTGAIRALNPPRFNAAYSDTGGSDTELFTRVRESGVRICWCDEATAWEEVPASRITREWVVRRQQRLGNVRGRIAGERKPQAFVVVLGFAYLGYSVARLTVNALRGRGRDSYADMRFWRGVGILNAVRGHYVREYRR